MKAANVICCFVLPINQSVAGAMTRVKWSPLDQKAIVWWAEQNKARLQLPLAWPQVKYLMPDGTVETKELIHLRVAYERWRKNKRKDKEELA
jgi:hypothetical protein